MAQLLAAGITDIGENRLPSLAKKQHAAADGTVDLAAATWHFIGRLQSRDVPELCDRVACIHSLASESAARKLAVQAQGAQGDAMPKLLVQVNVAGDAAKEGIEPGALFAFLEQLPVCLVVQGLMTMPPYVEDAAAEKSRGDFARLRVLCEAARERFGERHPLTEMSMGTSQDHLVAAEEGATLVRLGRVLYAPLLDDTL